MPFAGIENDMNTFKGKDLCGNKYHRFTVVSFAGKKNTSGKRLNAYWNCNCDCGEIRVVKGGDLTNGRYKSCGCLSREILLNRITKHGMCYSPIYECWQGMHSRCKNRKNKSFAFYGGRGIKVCARWSKFDDFLKDMGSGYSEGLTLDRINTFGDYCPENCRWATRKQQSNNRRSNKPFTFNGQTKNMREWSEVLGGSKSLVQFRIKSGWTVEDALSYPAKRRTNQFSSQRQHHQPKAKIF